jgi:hypothetical protein
MAYRQFLTKYPPLLLQLLVQIRIFPSPSSTLTLLLLRMYVNMEIHWTLS